MNKPIIALMVITDGRREYLQQTLEGAKDNLVGEITHWLMIDDSNNLEYAEWLHREYPEFFISHSSGGKRGFAGAIQHGWSRIPPDTEYVVHLEDDFLFNRPWFLMESVSILSARTDIAQMCLRRQPWGSEPLDGGFIAQWPSTYSEQMLNGIPFLTHRNFFSTNPSIYPKRITAFGWPDAPDSEGKFGPKLWDAGYCCAFLGTREDSPRVTHIGLERAGNGY